MNKMAEEAFQSINLSPNYAFILLAILEKPGISQKELCSLIHIQPSTMTRFIDKLQKRGLISLRQRGRTSQLFLTKKGEKQKDALEKAWAQLHESYVRVIGQYESRQLAQAFDRIGNALHQK